MSTQISVCTYTGQLFGWKKAEDGTWDLIYAFQAAETPARICTSLGNRLVVASDEAIIMFDLKRKKQSGSLLHHTHTVSALSFAGDKTLLSADETGVFCIWETSDWTPVLSVNAHKGRIVAISVQSSNKLALSAGEDKRVRLWDLTKGRPVVTITTKAVPLDVQWLFDGPDFVVLSRNSVAIYSGSDGVETASFELEEKFHCMRIYNDGDDAYVLIGTESGKVIVWNVKDSEITEVQIPGNSRVKRLALKEQDGDDFTTVIVALGNGIVSLWNINEIVKEETVAKPLVTLLDADNTHLMDMCVN